MTERVFVNNVGKEEIALYFTFFHNVVLLFLEKKSLSFDQHFIWHLQMI